MNRRLLALGGLACLVLAVLLRPVPPSHGDGVLAAVGRSLGGSRVMLVDALFLRAEAQRKAGHVEDAAALYSTVLDLDPANEAATVFLVNVYTDELIPQILDPEERHIWWLQARGLLDRALERRPDSASLHARAAGIVLDARWSGGALEGRPEAEVRTAVREALTHLLRAVELAETLPRLGRVHLVRTALVAPAQAAAALERGAPEDLAQALALGDQALALRGEVLSEVQLEEGTSLSDVLQTGLAAVRAAQAGDAATARALIERCRLNVPGWRLIGHLRAVLDR